MTCIVNELCQRMSNLHTAELCKVESISWALEASRAVGIGVQFGNDGWRSEDIFRLRPGRLQGDTKIIKCVILVGIHIARSSAESKLYAAALGASESKGIVSLLICPGYAMKPVLAPDDKALETHSPQTRKCSFETHRCSIYVDTR